MSARHSQLSGRNRPPQDHLQAADTMVAVVRSVVRRMGAPTAAFELGCDPTTARRLASGSTADARVGHLAACLCWERDRGDSREIVDAVLAIDGRTGGGDGMGAEYALRGLSQAFATELALMLERLESGNRVDGAEAAATACEMRRLMERARKVLPVLDARARSEARGVRS